MNCDNNQSNNGCNCNPNQAPAPADISMSVCDRNINMLPMLQTYTTKVLKPNIEGCCRKNILTQQMMNCEEYKYVIKWDFDLDGKTITMPNNCILEFDGGTISNGKLIGKVRNKEFYPEWFGAKADGVHDDTKSIQQCIDLSDKYGGTVMLARGVYMVSHIDLKTKTHLKGVGIGASIIKSNTAYEGGIVNILRNSTQCKISDISIVGNKEQDGIHADAATRTSDTEPIDYPMSYWLEENTDIENNMQSYRNLIIDNVYVGVCRYGMYFSNFCYRTIVTKCDIKRCVYGVYWPITDSSIHECYIEGCDRDGFIGIGSNNNVTNIKSIWNGIDAPYESFGMMLRGNRNRYCNIEIQDNYCSGVWCSGNHNLYSNIVANHDGYKFNQEYEEENNVYTCEWYINTLNSHFSNCEVDNYVGPNDDRHGGKLPTYPVYYETGIIQNQNIYINSMGNAIARNPIRSFNHLTTSPIFNIDYTKIIRGKGYEVFGNDGLTSIPFGYDIPASSEFVFLFELLLGDKEFNSNIVVSYAGFMHLTIRPNGTASAAIGWPESFGTTDNVVLGSVNSEGVLTVGFDKTKPMRAGASSKIIGVDENGHMIYELTFGIWYFDTIQKGYVYQITRNTDIHLDKISSIIRRSNLFEVQHSSEQSSRNDFYLRQVLVTDTPCVLSNVTYPGSPLYGLNNILSFDYEGADENLRAFAGNSDNRPSLVNVGARYFDTDLGAPILWGGKNWVFADGNPINIKRAGTTAERPGTEPSTSVPKNIGFAYYDTDLGSFIYWNGKSWTVGTKLFSFGVVNSEDDTLCDKFCVKVAENSNDTEDFDVVSEINIIENNSNTEESSDL